MKFKANVGTSERWISAWIGGFVMLAAARDERRWRRKLLYLVGTDLFQRGLSGYCAFYGVLGMSTRKPRGIAHSERKSGVLGMFGPKEIQFQRSVTIQRPREELYQYWRNVENLQAFMGGIQCVDAQDDWCSHWVIQKPDGQRLEWDAEITEEIENERIAWRSVRPAELQISGEVIFTPAPGNRGTQIRQTVRYRSPKGPWRWVIEEILGREPGKRLQSNLRRFKELMETGEILAS